MKLIIFAVLFVATLAQADRPKPVPKNIHVRPVLTPPVHIRPRIVGGEEAEPNAFPFVVGLDIDDGASFCGGFIYNLNTIVTAAHCLVGVTSVEVIAGAHEVGDASEPNQQRRVIQSSGFILHENWTPTDLSNDIALVLIPQANPLTSNAFVAEIPLRSTPCADPTIDTATGAVCGWGWPSDIENTNSPLLRWAEGPVLPNTECNQYFGLIKNTNICLSGETRTGTCNGDSGGPLVVNNQVAGIASFGSAWGCEIGYPTVYTRITCYTTWIADNIA